MPDMTADGGRKPRVTDRDLLDIFRSSSDPVLSTAEVADAIPIKRRGTLNRLRSLEDSGALDSKQIGGRNTVWWLVDRPADVDNSTDTQPPRDGRDSVEATSGDGHDRSDTPPTNGRRMGEVAPTDSTDSSDPIASIDLPSGVDVDAAHEAYDAVREFLREEGPAKMRTIVSAVMPTHALGYDVPDLEAGDRYRGAWWRKVIRPALDADPSVTHRSNHGDYDV